MCSTQFSFFSFGFHNGQGYKPYAVSSLKLVKVPQCLFCERKNLSGRVRVSALHASAVNMLDVRMEGGKERRSGRRRSFVFRLAAIIIICSGVITALGVCCLDQTTDGGRQRSSCRQSSSHLCKLSLINRRKRQRRRSRTKKSRREGGKKMCGAASTKTGPLLDLNQSHLCTH